MLTWMAQNCEGGETEEEKYEECGWGPQLHHFCAFGVSGGGSECVEFANYKE